MSRKFVDYYYEFMYSLLITAILFRGGCNNKIYMYKNYSHYHKNYWVRENQTNPEEKYLCDLNTLGLVILYCFFLPFLD